MHSWYNFISGILANMKERNTWRFNSGKYEQGKSKLLCPVLFCGFGGLFIVMRTVDYTIKDCDYTEWDCSEHIEHFGGDDTVSNYGILSGRLVKIDYGD